MQKDTVSIYFVRAALAQLPAKQLPAVLKEAGISAELLAVPQARVAARAFSSLWLAVARALDDEFFGLDARRMKVGSFVVLCHAVLGSDRLERAVRLMLRSFATFLDDISAELIVDGDDAAIVLSDCMQDAARRRFAHETLLVLIHGLMCWLVGRRIPLLRAEFAYAAPPQAQEYRVMYAERLVFNSARTAVYFKAEWLEASVVQTEASLKAFLRRAPQSVFLKYKNVDSWAARLRRYLRSGLQGNAWPTMAQAAADLGLTLSTLRRRLEAEGASYQSVKDDLRRDMAIDLLCRSARSVADISASLGFEDPSTFHRAFRKWVGVQPGQYRARAAQSN